MHPPSSELTCALLLYSATFTCSSTHTAAGRYELLRMANSANAGRCKHVLQRHIHSQQQVWPTQQQAETTALVTNGQRLPGGHAGKCKLKNPV
jgi:hypothetical protein